MTTSIMAGVEAWSPSPAEPFLHLAFGLETIRRVDLC